MRNLVGGLLVSLLLVLPKDGNSESFDPFSKNGAEITASIVALLSLGIEQGIVEACNGDVAPIGRKLIALSAAAKSSGRENLFFSVAPMFGEGQYLGRKLGCDVDRLRTFAGWGDLYYAPVLNLLSGR